MPNIPTLTINGFRIYQEALGRAAQEAVIGDLRDVLARAPFYRPEMPHTGKTYSTQMTNCGPFGWVSTRAGYRYQANHPVTGQPWGPMPPCLLDLWADYAGHDAPPEAALITLYRDKARLGLHVDDTEDDPTAPVVSLSLGDTGVFRIGGAKRTDPTRSARLASGTIVVMGGPARFFHHGVDRILPGSSTLLEGGGRLSVTLRRVTAP